MASSNFDKCLKFTLRYEGGFSIIRSDPGNWTGGKVGVGELRGTNYGIAAHAHPDVDIRNLTVKQAGEIYREQYWDTVQGDKLPPGVDLMVFDFAVNSGPSRAAKALQKVVGVRQDGVIGLQTIRAVNERNPAETITAMSEIRGRFFRSLKTFKTFGKGWMARNNAVRVAALGMARGYAPHHAPDDPGEGKPEAAAKADPADKSMTKSTTAGAAAAAGAAGAITPTIEAVKQAQEAAEAGKGIWDVAASVGPWVLLALVIAGAAAYIIWERKRRAREEGV